MQLNSSGSSFVLLHEHKWKFKVFFLHSFYFRTPLASKSLYCFICIYLYFVLLSYYLLYQEHFYLETQVTIAVPKGEDGEMELYVSTQNPTRTQVCYLSSPIRTQVLLLVIFLFL